MFKKMARAAEDFRKNNTKMIAASEAAWRLKDEGASVDEIKLLCGQFNSAAEEAGENALLLESDSDRRTGRAVPLSFGGERKKPDFRQLFEIYHKQEDRLKKKLNLKTLASKRKREAWQFHLDRLQKVLIPRARMYAD